MLTLAAALPLVNLLSRAIPKMFPSVFHDIHGRMSALSYGPVFLCHWVTPAPSLLRISTWTTRVFLIQSGESLYESSRRASNTGLHSVLWMVLIFSVKVGT